LVYGTEAVFPVQFGIPVMKFLQNSQEEPDDMQRRIFEMIELQQNREKVDKEAQQYRAKVKNRFDKNIKQNIFTEGEMVLRWDVRKEQKGNMANLIIFVWPFSHIKIFGK